MLSATPDSAVTTAGTPVTIDVLANDTGTGLVITSFSNPANGSLVYNSGDKSFTYTPAAGFVGDDTFSYTVRDAQGTPATAEVTISVVASGGATVATDDHVEVVAGGSVIVPVLANDMAAGGGELQIIAVSNPRHGVVNVLPDQRIRYVPQSGFVGIDNFTYTVLDQQGATASATVTVKVVAENSAPIAMDDAFDVVADTTTVLAVLANDSDPDGGTLQVVGFTMPSHGNLVFNSADKTFAYTPAAGYEGQDQFTYTIRDNRGASASASVTLTVARIVESPVANDDQVTTEAGVPVTIDVLANDSLPADQNVGIIAVTLPFRGKLDFNADKTITYTPNTGFVGTDDFTYTIGNGKGSTAKATVTIQVTPGTGVNAYQNGYDFRRRLAVPTGSAKGANHQNFPLWIELAGNWLKSNDNGGKVASPAGDDLRFELADGTKLAHELELYDAAAGKLGAWVRVPELRADAATELLLYYGKPGLQASEAAPQAVWQDYLAVWHLPSIVDASGNARDLSPTGDVADASLGLGDGAVALGGAGVLTIADVDWLQGLDGLSIQLWNKAAAIGHDQGQFGIGEALFDGDSDLFIRYQSAGFGPGEPKNLLHTKLKTTAGNLTTSSPANTQTTDWQAVALTWEAADTQSSLYLDGNKVQASFTTFGSGEGTTQLGGPLYIGAGTQDSATGGWTGLIDEVRLRSGKLSDAWIAAEHANQTHPALFYGIGAEDGFGDPSDSVVAVPFELTGKAGTALDIDVLADAVSPAAAGDVTIQSVGQPTNGVVSVIDGKIRYSPPAGFAGADTFLYTLAADGKKSTAEIRIHVEQANDVTFPTANVINVADYSQLTNAIAAAAPGDEVVLANGVYSGTQIIVDKSGDAQQPIVIRSADILGANVPNGFRVTGSNVILYGIDFNANITGDNKVQVGGQDNQVWRCRFRYNGGQNNLHLINGSGCRVMYCEFTVVNPNDDYAPSSRNLGSWNNNGNRHYNAEIGHCWFHDLPSKPAGEPYSTRARSAIGLNNYHIQSLIKSNWWIHHCLLENCGNSRFNVKMSGNTIEYCTITGKTGTNVSYSTDFNQRFGENNTWRGCWSENADGYRVQGKGNKYISCKSVNSTATDVAVGDHDAPPEDPGNPRADKSKFTACEFTLRVGGMGWAGNLPARDTRIENHQGSVSLVSGNHTGTVQTGQMTETPVTPIKITPAMVGPFADTV